MKIRSPKLRRIPKGQRRNPLRLDPTRTLALRQRATAMVRRQFDELARRVEDLVVRENAFGMVANAPGRFAFEMSAEKLKSFERWLRTQLRALVLGKTREQLWQEYVHQGYAKGVGRSFDDYHRKRRMPWRRGENDFHAGSKKEFLRSSFANPESVDKVKLLAGRTFADVKGVTERMATKMRRVLVDGLVQGKHPRRVGAELAKEVHLGKIQAETVAVTEISRAHAEGQLDALEDLGVEEVGAMVEWLVTDDEKLCPLCAELEDEVFTIAQARGMLPRHPNCRCAWAPYFADFDKPRGRKAKHAMKRSRRFAERKNQRTAID